MPVSKLSCLLFAGEVEPMIIRCPHCEHTRSISESKIPSTAELATCPKCKHRFRFRTLRPPLDENATKTNAQSPPPERPASRSGPAARPAAPVQEVIRPQQAFRESAEQRDIWDAVDELHQRWEAQLDQHVTDVSLEPLPDAAAPEHDFSDPAAASGAAAEPPLPEVHKHDEAAPAGQEPLPHSQVLPEPYQPESHRPASAPPRSAPIATPQADPADTSATHEAHGAASTPVEPMPPAAPAAPAASAAPAAPAASAPERPRFLYAEDGPDPEERVEQDLRMLHTTDASRPTRDLGRLKEYPAGVEGGENGGNSENSENAPDLLVLPGSGSGPDKEDGVPWERGGNRLRSFWATVRGSMFGGPAFFAGISGAGSLAPGYLFFLLMGYIGALGAWAWFAAAKLLIPDLAAHGPAATTLPALLLLGPAALGLILLFITGWVRLSLRLLAPDKADFGKIYKVVSYSVGPLILCIAPFVGPLLGAAWSLVALAVGCRGALGLSRPLAVCVPVPSAALVLGFAAWCLFP